ncbi:hypothetical protein HJG60_009127 [Phyllostomus discolor]|uniref:Uncharacterized protein n=1 Tax=Phyllostomus discolor TaxID=89673 RepID=A0A833YPG6_9CHIR|nr:hypothetical protein HJG60_009127 [Phyllostomus discolor]
MILSTSTSEVFIGPFLLLWSRKHVSPRPTQRSEDLEVAPGQLRLKGCEALRGPSDSRDPHRRPWAEGRVSGLRHGHPSGNPVPFPTDLLHIEPDGVQTKQEQQDPGKGKEAGPFTSTADRYARGLIYKKPSLTR